MTYDQLQVSRILVFPENMFESRAQCQISKALKLILQRDSELCFDLFQLFRHVQTCWNLPCLPTTTSTSLFPTSWGQKSSMNSATRRSARTSASQPTKSWARARLLSQLSRPAKSRKGSVAGSIPSSPISASWNRAKKTQATWLGLKSCHHPLHWPQTWQIVKWPHPSVTSCKFSARSGKFTPSARIRLRPARSGWNAMRPSKQAWMSWAGHRACIETLSRLRSKRPNEKSLSILGQALRRPMRKSRRQTRTRAPQETDIFF